MTGNMLIESDRAALAAEVARHSGSGIISRDDRMGPWAFACRGHDVSLGAEAFRAFVSYLESRGVDLAERARFAAELN